MKRIKVYFNLGIVLLMVTTMFYQVSANTADTLPPTIPKGLSATSKTHTTISLNWTASTDNNGVKGYEVYRDGKKIVTTRKTNYTNINLIPGRNYTYSIKAYDTSGNLSDSSTSLTVTTVKDTQPPSVPKNLTASSISYTTLALSWEPSTDDVGIKGYEIYSNGKKIASTTATYYVCKSLMPGSSYTFAVKAYDIPANYSMQSNNCSVVTTPDKTPPTIPSKLKASTVSATEVGLEWSPSSDNVKVKGYEVFCDGKYIGKTSKTTFSSKKLIPGKSYNYSVRAFDGSNNVSGRSLQLQTKTLSDVKPPQSPSKLTASTPTKSSVSLKWQASSDDIKLKGYHIYCNGIRVATTTRTSYTVKGLRGLGLGIFYVKAYDLADNLSQSSNTVVVILP